MEDFGKREAILQTTLYLVAKNGFHGTPISQIAKQANVAAGTIYHYFESKDVLIKETYDFVEEHLLAAIKKDYPLASLFRECYMHIGRKLIGSFVNSPVHYLFFEQFHNSPYGAAYRRDRILGRLGDNVVMGLFEDALEQHVIKELPLMVLYALTFGPLMQITRDHIFELIELDEILIEKIVEACWNSVKR